MLQKYKIVYKKFFRIREFEIEAFSMISAVDKFRHIIPRCKILYITEVIE